MSRTFCLWMILLFAFLLLPAPAHAQDTVTGAFEGVVTNSQTGQPIAGAAAEISNVESGLAFNKRTDARGRFYQGLLAPGVYRIRVTMAGFQSAEVLQRLNIARTGEVVPVPVGLEPLPAAAAPATPAIPPPAAPAPSATSTAATDIRASIATAEASRRASFTEAEITTLPLGGVTLVRSFDQLAFLAAGVAPPPQTLGSAAGPGQGAGVGTSGQFAVNGLRSRANNFTVDGSDNNDDDIGVRRQGFVALTPQPIESVKEYQIITLLAPAQFGRNFGGIVNAVSRSGGNQPHGTLYGFFNSSRLNARNFFDTTGDETARPLRTADNRNVLLEGQALNVSRGAGRKESSSFTKFGGAMGGPVRRDRMFYFLSAEGQIINARQEENFAVPTVEQRGAFGSGATGIFNDPLQANSPVLATPASRNGSAVFNLFPFPNNPDGVFGPNTFTQQLPADARGTVFSTRLDHNFKTGGRPQSVAGRYNFTNDRRVIPVTGEAIFSSIEPRVQTQNFSFFLNSQLSAHDAARAVFNQLRASYGRTRLDFHEVRDPVFLIPSRRFPNEPFLLNAPLRFNNTLPSAPGQPNSNPVTFINPRDLSTVEEEIGTVGQVIINGFSPVGVDVYHFPQQRVNNTYQLADELTLRAGSHGFAFGTDLRRIELNSDLPRNSRPLAIFNGSPRLIPEGDGFRLPNATDVNAVLRPNDLAAFGAASSFLLTLNTTPLDAKLALRFYQYNFFGQDQWRIRPNLTLGYGLRYEYTAPPRDTSGRLETAFGNLASELPPGLLTFLEDRLKLFDPDRNNFAPRLSVAYSPRLLGKNLATVFRAGYGLYHDQILGSVTSQSRNVFPLFLPLNFGGGAVAASESNRQFPLGFFNPARTRLLIPDGTPEGKLVPLLQPGTLSQLNPEVTLAFLLENLKEGFPSALGSTIPLRKLPTPLAHHYTVVVEQQLASHLTVSAAYVGTLGRNLLRFTTPNLGPGANIVLTSFQVQAADNTPQATGRLFPPARPVAGVGAIYRFETTASSRYDSLQLQVRGRFQHALQYQATYVFSKALDDVSDVFDLAGAFALPQNSLNLANERGAANFDARHRFTYYLVLDLAALRGDAGRFGWLLDGLQITGAGQAQTGQPFTVNTYFDVNLDGNLTDRLNRTTGLQATGNGQRPLRLLNETPLSLLAPFGQDGAVGRNTFRAGGLVELDLAVSKSFAVAGQQQIVLRADFFNFINRANFGIPGRVLEAPGFGQATRTVTPGRRIQFALKYVF